MANSNPPSDSLDADNDANPAMCCANFYEQDIVQELMGGSFHPGGVDLSTRLVESLSLPAGSKVLDVACGVGTTTRLMAEKFGLVATGLDYSSINVQKAKSAVATQQPAENPATEAQPCCASGEACCSADEDEPLANLNRSLTDSKSLTPIHGAPTFVQGSADALAMDAESLEGVTCECAVSTFADQAKVAKEFFRVLKPGGVFGMTDMVVDGQLPDDFAEKAAPWTCVAQALSIKGYQTLFAQAGFEILHHQDHSHTLVELAREMKRKLVMAGMGQALGALPALGMDLKEMRAMLNQSTELVKSQTIQYALLVFRKPRG